jgi:adenylate cyclase
MPQDDPAPAGPGRVDPSAVVEGLEVALLGGARTYDRTQVAERAGVPLARAERLWRSLGFASVADDEVVFGDSDVEALATIAGMVDTGVVSQDTEAALARSMGQAMARLADWQTTVLADAVYGDQQTAAPSVQETVDLAGELVPVLERLQTYVWHRHLIAAAGRMVPVAADDPLSDTTVAGFADIVGFTKLSRSLGEDELAALVERFESTTAGIIAEHGGRVVKTIGDEVMFTVRDPAAAAAIALQLMAWVEADDDLPRLRIGMAHGRVISWLGDVYGPIVNVASRLTSVARPGSTLVDRGLAAELKELPGQTLRRVPRVSVRGYSSLEPWVLRPGG